MAMDLEGKIRLLFSRRHLHDASELVMIIELLLDGYDLDEAERLVEDNTEVADEGLPIWGSSHDDS